MINCQKKLENSQRDKLMLKEKYMYIYNTYLNYIKSYNSSIQWNFKEVNKSIIDLSIISMKFLLYYQDL